MIEQASIGESKKEPPRPALGCGRLDHESRRPLHEREQDRRIEPGNVIDHNDIRRSRGRQAFPPCDFEPEQDPPQGSQGEDEDVRALAAPSRRHQGSKHDGGRS
jgi:hypothetical protein